MIELFFHFTVKCTVLPNNIFFSTCCGGLLYGPAVYSKIRQIRDIGFTSRSPLFVKS
jgi:hypothetical protein